MLQYIDTHEIKCEKNYWMILKKYLKLLLSLVSAGLSQMLSFI